MTLGSNMTVKRANELIPWIPCKQVNFPKGNQSFEQVKTEVLNVLRDRAALLELYRFAQDFRGGTDFQRRLLIGDLMRFVRENIAYYPDRGTQWVKNPICTWSQRMEGADCKSLTVFIYAVLYCLQMPRMVNIFIYPSYEENEQLITPSHIFSSTIIGGEEIYLDATIDSFNKLPSTPIKWIREIGI